ncbi:hypothetical protein K504DRAFT_491028 [Pleomassaria siparia CBS 279.74]|uniref:Uncharacterized protein n=1 Tax=Pleomassaria siparia CBS 279.74 TaxID=1314801 RepID=A0A6G1KB19_9PLEO|nr:hypothetical protein K504DRAFT_491028 [Pleomassaria siparia CBS 279.74]
MTIPLLCLSITYNTNSASLSTQHQNYTGNQTSGTVAKMVQTIAQKRRCSAQQEAAYECRQPRELSFRSQSTAIKNYLTKSNIDKEVSVNATAQPSDIGTSPTLAELHTRNIHCSTVSMPEITPRKYGSTTKPIAATTANKASPMSGARAEDIVVAKVNLNSYFDGLKKEFEDKTGRAWTPLEPTKDEEAWDWDDELASDDLVDLDGFE